MSQPTKKMHLSQGRAWIGRVSYEINHGAKRYRIQIDAPKPFFDDTKVSAEEALRRANEGEKVTVTDLSTGGAKPQTFTLDEYFTAHPEETFIAAGIAQLADDTLSSKTPKAVAAHVRLNYDPDQTDMGQMLGSVTVPLQIDPNSDFAKFNWLNFLTTTRSIRNLQVNYSLSDFYCDGLDSSASREAFRIAFNNSTIEKEGDLEFRLRGTPEPPKPFPISRFAFYKTTQYTIAMDARSDLLIARGIVPPYRAKLRTSHSLDTIFRDFVDKNVSGWPYLTDSLTITKPVRDLCTKGSYADRVVTRDDGYRDTSVSFGFAPNRKDGKCKL